MPYIGKTPSQATRQRYYKTASGGETSISGTMTTGGTLTFNDGEFVDVKLNGVSLVAGTDYNTSTANTIAGLSALAANDQVEIVVYDTFSVFSGDVDSNLSVGGNLSVTGTSALTGAATITTDDNNPQLTLTTTDADAGTGPTLDLFRDSASPADADVGGKISFTGKNDAGETLGMTIFQASHVDVSDGTEDAKFAISSRSAGSMVSRLNLDATETVFNEDSVDVDFRVESDNATNALFVQGSDGKVGINTAAPNLQTSINFDSSAVAGLGIHDTNSGNLGGMLQFYSGSGQGTLRGNIQNANNAGIHVNVGTGSVVFTQTGYTAANALDDYEEGTFTPEIRIGGSTSGITNNSQVGQYTKIGRMVTLTGRVSISDKGSNTGAMTIAGMPFASQNTSNLESFGVVELQNMSTGTDNLGSLTNNNVYCRISPNVLTIEMRRTMHDANDITNVQMTDTTVVGFTITYFT